MTSHNGPNPVLHRCMQRALVSTALCALLFAGGCKSTPKTQQVTTVATDNTDIALPADSPSSAEDTHAVSNAAPATANDEAPTIMMPETRQPDGAESPMATADSANMTSDAVKSDGVEACTQESVTPLPVVGTQPAIPALTRRITDLTGWLTPECTESLTVRLASLEKTTGAQIAVLLTNSTDDDEIDRYADRVFSQWKLGRKGVDDGILFVADIKHHHARIEVGYGLEGTIPDAVAGDILREDMQPNFRKGLYNTGVSAVVDDLARRVEGGPLPAPTLEASHSTGRAFFFAMLALSAVLGGIGEAMHLRWPNRILLPALTISLCVLVAVPLHLTPGYRTIGAMIPVSVFFSLIGIPFVRSTRESFQWLRSWIAASVIFSIIALLAGRSKGMSFGDMSNWFVAAIAGGFFAGSLAFFLVKIFSGSHRSPGGWTTPRDRDDVRSSSSSDSSSSSSSSSSDSGSFSGGGGSSGGGGASSDW